MKRWILVVLISGLASFALASGEFLETFKSYYHIKDDSPLAEKSCGICHISDSDFAFNPYGKDVKKAMTDSGSKEVTGELLASIEGLDSDGDGTPNGREIAAGTFPGDPLSGGAPGAHAPVVVETAKKKASFPPKNGFHPAIVHFPIALFIGALDLDLIGMIRKDSHFMLSGWYCLVMAAITSFGGIASGVLAMIMQKLPYRGLIFTHLVLAIISTVLMWVMVELRVHRHEKMHLPARLTYYLLAASCFVLISYAGHLGGAFVYGE